MSSTIHSNIVEHHPAMSWRSVVAGLLISFFVFGILLSLGIAIGGVSLTDGASLQNAGIMSGVWMLVSVLLSLFAGSYFASRISNYIAPWVGMAQGAVVAALFIGTLFYNIASLASWVASSAGSLASSAVQAGAPAAQQMSSQLNVGVNEIIEDNLAGVQFKGEPTTVMSGVASRLVRGNPDSAKAYLARNSNLSVSDVNTRIDQLQVQLRDAGDKAATAAAGAMKAAGWTLFGTMVLGLIVSVFAGILGSRANAGRPAVDAGFMGFRTFHHATPAR